MCVFEDTVDAVYGVLPCLGLLDDVGAGLPDILSAGDGSLLSMGVALIRGTVTCRLPPVFKGSFFLGAGIDFIERLLLE